MRVVERKRQIYKLLEDPKIRTVVLHGKAGVGKTWTAREVTSVAILEGLFDIVLWLYLNREYDDNTLRDCIAEQLFPLLTRGVSELDDAESEKEKALQSDDLIKKIKWKKLVVILDDEGNKMKELKVRRLLENVLKLDPKSYNAMVTRRNEPTNVEIQDDGRKYFKVDPLIRKESLSLLIERTMSDHHDHKGIKTLAKNFLQRTEDIPIAIIMMAKAFKYFLFDKEEVEGMALLRRYLEEPSDSNIYNITDLLCSGYDLVPYNMILDFQRDANDKEKPLFNGSRCINHNELIAYWMMEGYLGPIHCIETVYRKGHEILMELLDFQILKRGDADYVTINPLREEFDNFILRKESNYYRRGYYANACLGLRSVLSSVEWKGFIWILHKDGVMTTLPGGKDGIKASGLLLDGNFLAKQLPSKLMSSLKKLHVLAIFYPTMDILSLFSSDIIGQLHVFVLRKCGFMKNIDWVHGIESLGYLTVLEISGPVGSFNDFPEDFFSKMCKLQSLNLSSLPITSLPLSFYELDELKWLILRGCTSLTSLGSLKNCKNLLVLDCSGSTSLNKIRYRNFMNANLEMINLSSTKIKTLPLLAKLKKLTHLLLSKCSSIIRLPTLSNMASLEVIDLSYASSFIEFYDKSLEKLVNLKVLDLSGTGVKLLPENIGDPRHLCLESCTQLRGKGVLKCIAEVTGIERFVLSDAGIQSLPPISHLTNIRQLSVTCCLDLEAVPDLSSLEKLEELDFSGCKSIKSIPDKTFDKMCRLQNLNLSGISIESLPSLSNLSNLRRLLLKDCKELKELPSLDYKSLGKLEELNINGCKALANIEANFFDGAVNLHFLDLSDTLLDKLPSLSKLMRLCELHLRNCKGLVSVPDLETLTNLEILDLSGSAVSTLPMLSKLRKLRQLRLNNCSALSLFREIGTLNVLGGASIQNLPYGISGLTSLELFELPNMESFQGAEIKERNVVEAKSDSCEWGICSLSAPKEKRPSVSLSGAQFLHSLQKDPLLWESTLKKFHLCVYPVEVLDEKSEQNFRADDFIYRDMYLQNRHIGGSDNQRLLEVYGFPGYKPESIDTVLSHANQIFFVNDKLEVRIPATEKNKEEIIQTLPSFLATCNPKEVKGCWIDKCRKIEEIFSEKEIDNILGLLNSVETLWVSNAMSLKSIFEISQDGEEIPGHEVFIKLDKLYLECCPKLSTVLHLTQLPRKLKILQIKFCDKLEKVFVPPQETKLQYLESLHLWELPELKSIGCQLPSLKTLKISNCPNLLRLGEIIESAKYLQELSISNVHELEMIEVPKELKKLRIESCPKLLNIFSMSQPSSDLEIHIRFCFNLETIFGEGTSSETKLKMLHLLGLPKIRSIGATLPDQATCFIGDCQNLNA